VSDDADYGRLDQAWEALDAGDPERALELVRDAAEDLAEVWVLRATASLDLDDLDGARAAAAQAAGLEEGASDPELDCILAEIALREWDVDAARERLERAAAQAESPYVLAKLALVADLDGDYGRADRLLRDAQRLDAGSFPLPPRLSERELDQAIAAAIRGLPEAFQRALEDVPVIVDPMPARGLEAERPAGPDLLGSFAGASLAERSHGEGLDLPPSIHLYQRNLERSCADRAELVEQIRVTLYHELGHYLGFDEEGVADLGLE
jgi:predicted Zn-dependent protease with MMP-like domain